MVITEPDDVTPPELLPVDGGPDPDEPDPAAAEVAPTGELEAHRARALAAIADLPDDVALSYVSAACLHDLLLWDVPLLNGPVHGTRPKPGVPISRVKLSVRTSRLAAEDLAEAHGVRVTSVARTLVDVGRWASRSTAVVCADAALRDGLVSRTDLDAALDRAFGTSGVYDARIALSFADGRSPGIAASRARVAARWPEPQPKSRPWGASRYDPHPFEGWSGRDDPDERYGPYERYERYGPDDAEEPYEPHEPDEQFGFRPAHRRAAQRWGTTDERPDPPPL